MKSRAASPEQLDVVFQPVLSPVCATIAWFGQPPEGFDKLEWSPDRGGECRFHQFTISTYGDDNRRVAGVRVWDPAAGLYKEELQVYDRATLTVTI
jgi:hypothetical protein